jgi:diphthamide biosynthesis protein 4
MSSSTTTTTTNTWYKVLGIEAHQYGADADNDVFIALVKKQYRTLARTLHPDRASESQRGEAAERFREVNFAYQLLSDVDKRREYDARLAAMEAWRKDPPIVSEEFDLSDFELCELPASSGFAYEHRCRCSGLYRVSEFELSQGFDILACSSCSLYVRVHFQQCEQDEQDEDDKGQGIVV